MSGRRWRQPGSAADGWHASDGMFLSVPPPQYGFSRSCNLDGDQPRRLGPRCHSSEELAGRQVPQQRQRQQQQRRPRAQFRQMALDQELGHGEVSRSLGSLLRVESAEKMTDAVSGLNGRDGMWFGSMRGSADERRAAFQQQSGRWKTIAARSDTSASSGFGDGNSIDLQRLRIESSSIGFGSDSVNLEPKDMSGRSKVDRLIGSMSSQNLSGLGNELLNRRAETNKLDGPSRVTVSVQRTSSTSRESFTIRSRSPSPGDISEPNSSTTTHETTVTTHEFSTRSSSPRRLRDLSSSSEWTPSVVISDYSFDDPELVDWEMVSSGWTRRLSCCSDCSTVSSGLGLSRRGSLLDLDAEGLVQEEDGRLQRAWSQPEVSERWEAAEALETQEVGRGAQALLTTVPELTTVEPTLNVHVPDLRHPEEPSASAVANLIEHSESGNRGKTYRSEVFIVPTVRNNAKDVESASRPAPGRKRVRWPPPPVTPDTVSSERKLSNGLDHLDALSSRQKTWQERLASWRRRERVQTESSNICSRRKTNGFLDSGQSSRWGRSSTAPATPASAARLSNSDPAPRLSGADAVSALTREELEEAQRKVSACSYSSVSTLSQEDDDERRAAPPPRRPPLKGKSSQWRKVKGVVHWTPFVQTYKKQKYLWVQLAGHQGNFLPGKDGSIQKRLCGREQACLLELMEDRLRPFVPEYRGQVVTDEGETFLQLQDLLGEFVEPCVMDCKIGVRTYLEDELAKAKENPKLRKDMYEKMMMIDKNAPTEEEHRLKAVTKPRYMVWRETISSTANLGFRIEGIRKSQGFSSKDFKTTRSPQQIRDAVTMFTEGYPKAVPQYLERLKEIQAALVESTFFKSHEFIGSSLLFVHDTNHACVWMIDFAKTTPLPAGVSVDHKSRWRPGNHEDGYLTGVGNLSTIMTQMTSGAAQ